jgi:hypothetical protein
MTQPLRRCARLPDQPRPPPDDDHLREQPGVLPVVGAECAQADDEGLRIPAVVRVMCPDEVPAPPPGLIRLRFAHRQEHGRRLGDFASQETPPARSGYRLAVTCKTAVSQRGYPGPVTSPITAFRADQAP